MSELSMANESSGSSLTSSSASRSLLQRIRAHDAAAWNRLVTLYSPMILYWCRRWDLQDHDAADVFQEVFQAVATHIASFRKEQPGDTFRGWLRTITRNKIHDHFRRLGREPDAIGGTDAHIRFAQVPAPPPAEPDGDSGDAAESAAEQSLLHRALELIRGEFESRTWQAFWRTAVDDQPANEVAVELSMTPGAVRVAKSRVLHRLREELGDLID